MLQIYSSSRRRMRRRVRIKQYWQPEVNVVPDQETRVPLTAMSPAVIVYSVN